MQQRYYIVARQLKHAEKENELHGHRQMTWRSVLLLTPRLAMSLLFIVVDSVCLLLHPSVCHGHCFFSFVSRWNRAIFGPSVHHDPLYKTLFLDF